MRLSFEHGRPVEGNRTAADALQTRIGLASRRAFTLIEVVGVLAIVSILAALLLPKIFQALDNARVSHAAMVLNTIKTASAQHLAKLGQLAIDGSGSPATPIQLDGSDVRAAQFDQVLLAEQIIDMLFATRIGDGIRGANNTRIQLLQGAAPSATPDGSNSAFDLDAQGTPNDAVGSTVLVAVITGVLLEDARALNEILDGPALGENPAGHDFKGRVKYRKPGNNEGGNSQNNGYGQGNGNGQGKGNGNGKGQGDENGNSGGNGNQGNGATTASVYVYLTHN